MNQTDLFHIIGDISDDLIIEAGGPVKKVRRKRVSKTAALAAAIIVMLVLTAFASGVMIKSGSVSSTNIPDYDSVPTQQKLQEDIGIAPCIIERFSNGYVFEEGVIGKNKDFDENGRIVAQYKSLYCEYKRDNSGVTLCIDGSVKGIQMEDAEIAEIYKNSDIKYHAYTNKLVPGDYQLTKQDKADEASGKYVFSYGSNEVEMIEVQILGWEYNGLNYTFCARDNTITKGELVQMAKEIIDLQED